MGVLGEDLLRKYSPDKVTITEFHTKVVGTSFRPKDDIDAVEDGDFVLIDAEVGNPHDPYACRVVHDKTGKHVGYLAKVNSLGIELSKEVWENSVKHGHLYLGRISLTGGADGKHRGFNLLVRHLTPLE